MRKSAQSLIVGFIALAVFAAGGYVVGYSQGKQQAVRTLTPKSSVGPQQQSGVISAFSDSVLEISDPQTQEISKFTIEDTSVIRLADKNGIFQVADKTAFTKNGIVLIKNDGGVLHVDVVPSVQPNK
jgi:hypothetical protein